MEAIKNLESNDTFKKLLVTTLENPPPGLTYSKFSKIQNEIYGNQKYEIYCKIF